MRNNKTIKKPSFIKYFCMCLAIMWVITGILGGIIYLNSNRIISEYSAKKIEEVVSELSPACEDYYLLNAELQLAQHTVGDTSKSAEDTAFMLSKEAENLTYLMNKAAASGFYTELHAARYDKRFPSDEDIEPVIVRPSFENGISAHYSWNAGMTLPNKTMVFGSAVDPSTLSFDCNGEKMTLAPSGRFSISDAIGKDIYDNAKLPFWNLKDKFGPSSSAETSRTYYVAESRLDMDNIKFYPKTITTSDNGGKKVWTNEGKHNTSRWFDYTDENFEDIEDSTLVVYYMPYDLPSSEALTLAYDGKDFLKISDVNEGDRSGKDAARWFLYIAEPESIGLFDIAPGLVIANVALWLTAALIVALIISYIIYIRRRSLYRIVEYRRNVTNTIAHDLKTPLSAISVYSENLEENINNDKRSYYSSKIRESVSTMNSMIEGVLDYSKLESGKGGKKRKEISIKDVVKSEYDILADVLEKKKLKVNIKGEDVKIKTDEKFLRQALRNLLSNAAKFSRPETDVDILIDKTGLTMSNKTDEKIESIEDITKPFVMGDPSRGKENGTGLGLSIVESSLNAVGHKLAVSKKEDIFTARITW